MSGMDTEEPQIATTDLAEAGEIALNGPESLRERLRAQREESAGNKTLDLPLPERSVGEQPHVGAVAWDQDAVSRERLTAGRRAHSRTRRSACRRR